MKKGVTKGLGSLGHQRFFAYTEHHGGPVAMEGKSVAPSAVVWATGKSTKEVHVDRLLKGPGRPSTPHTSTHEGWLVRPIMSDCGRTPLAELRLEESCNKSISSRNGCSSPWGTKRQTCISSAKAEKI